VHGKPLVYLDNAATTQKPQAVIDAVSRFYAQDNANVHRGVHALSQRATDAFEAARARVQVFLHAAAAAEIIFVRGATEAINLVAQSFARPLLVPGDEILVSAMEHHSNIVPWQQVCQQTGAVLKVVPINEAGEFQFPEYGRLLGARTRLVAVTHVSNALGSVTDIARISALAHVKGIPVLVDGAQAIAHVPVDVRALDCDFYVFSGHKCFGPTGIGVLYGKRERLEAMPPWQAGGDMVRSVSFDGTEYMPVPHRFETGTPNISGAIGLGAAVDFVSAIGLEAIAAHEQRLLNHASAGLGRIPGVRIVGTARHKACGDNPLCGDHIDVYVRLEQGAILDIAFAGVSCAVAKASASLMTEAMMGRDAARGRALLHKFEQMVGSAQTEPDPELGELRIFADVRDFPSRVQCAMLAWAALRTVLHESPG
jgi:cysteine desulfurase/selenocysteine lyase